jgi:hypothetical protein
MVIADFQRPFHQRVEIRLFLKHLTGRHRVAFVQEIPPPQLRRVQAQPIRQER